MVASGLPVRNGDKHPSEVQNLSFMDYNSFDCLHGFQIAHLSLDLMAVIPGVLLPHNPQQRLRIRMGVHLTTHHQYHFAHWSVITQPLPCHCPPTIQPSATQANPDTTHLQMHTGATTAGVVGSKMPR